ncbi:MAG: condensation domain-containing protein, partial [Candidatus Tectomicrobia bacterium]|nr:condensation domain-containing protein [Candidatus Tectomicrobia bacterium]
MPSPHTYFLSHNQKDFWFLSQSAPESAAFNDALTARIRAPVDVPALQRACRTLAARHSVLRTTFPILNGEPVQAVHDDPKVCFEVTDAQAWTWDEMRQHVSAAYARPLDLEHGPVWRVDLFTRTAHDHILLVTMHEIICDAWSCGVILTELDVLYAAE